MALVTLTQIQPGMVLAAEVRDMSGRLLLNKGQEIETQHLRILKIWGIAEVLVCEQPVAEQALTSPNTSLTPEASAKIQDLFLHNDLTNSLIQEIYSYRLKSLSATGTGDDN